MTTIQTYQRPSSLEQAWSLLNEGGRSAMLVGGGVDVALFAPPEVRTLIDLARISSRSIEWRDGALVIGAGATLTEILESPLTAGYLDGIVGIMLRQVASPLLRNAATAGGTLASTHPWSDVITLFLALDAHATQYAGQTQTRPLSALLEQRGTIARAIITEVILPAPPPDTYASFESFVRTGFDVGMLNCACRLSVSDGVCSDARVVLGGTPDIGHRLETVESAVNRKSLNSAVIDLAAELAFEAVPARDDIRASADYRRVLARAGVRRCLLRIAQRIGELG